MFLLAIIWNDSLQITLFRHDKFFLRTIRVNQKLTRNAVRKATVQEFEVIYLLLRELHQIIPFFYTILLLLAFKDHMVNSSMCIYKCTVHSSRFMIIIFVFIQMRFNIIM